VSERPKEHASKACEVKASEGSNPSATANTWPRVGHGNVPLVVNVGFIGIGRMGMPVATNLASAGHAVFVTDIRSELAEAAGAAGLIWSTSPDVVAARAHVLMTMLPGPVECRDAVLGEKGALHGLRPGSTWVDLTSNSPPVGAMIAARVRQKGIEVLDAPVGGGIEAALNGTLTLYVGGDAVLLQQHRPLLEVIGADIRHVGPAGAGYITKLIINQLWFGNVVATAEVLLLAGKLGLDLGTLQTVLAGSPAGSEFIRSYLPSLLAGDYLPSFPIDRVVEELQSVSDLAHAHGVPFTVNTAVLAVHQRAADRYGAVDGELLAAALLEEQAQLLIRGDPEAHG